MDATVTYEWSEGLSKACQLAFYKDRTGRPGLVLVGGLLICVLGWVAEYTSLSPGLPIGLLGTVFGLLLIIAPVRIYIAVRRLAKDAAKFYEGDAKVTVTITDEAMTVASRNGNHTVEWERITRLKEVDRFLFLFTGKLLVANLPQEPFSDHQVEFIRRMVSK